MTYLDTIATLEYARLEPSEDDAGHEVATCDGCAQPIFSRDEVLSIPTLNILVHQANPLCLHDALVVWLEEQGYTVESGYAGEVLKGER